MRTSKHYTNTNFTKRVDHAAGHAPARALAEPCVCKECGAMYLDRRWTLGAADPMSLDHQRWSPPQLVTCPACKQIEEGVPGGLVHLEGAFFQAHRDEIERMMKNEAARAAEDNPLARIMKLEEAGENRLTVLTTTEHLAQRLGHALEKAFCGKAEYRFSHENKLTHVYWKR